MHDNGGTTEGDLPSDLPDLTGGFPYRGRRRLVEPLTRRVGAVGRLAVAGAAVLVAVVLVTVVNLARPDSRRPLVFPSQTPDASVTSGDAVLPPTAAGGSASASPGGSSHPASARASATPGTGATSPAGAVVEPTDPPSSSPPAPPRTVRYEAEAATISQGQVATNHAGFSGSGFVDCVNVAGSFVQWSVTGPGSATLEFRFANGTATGRPAAIAVNGVTVQTVTFPSTGSWDTWQTVTVTATLTAGANTVRAAGTTSDGPPNLDYLEVVA